jgi:hypothetical protein
MPENKVNDLITDQEMAYARLVLSGKMTDQQAAQAVGLNPSTAAYIKSKPRVRAYMLEYRALMQQQLVEQQAEESRRFHVGREQVLNRLWELANMSSEMTRGSINGQVKAVSMIIAIEGLIPDRRAGSAAKNPAPPPSNAYIDPSAWRREQQGETNGPQPHPAPNQDDQDDQQEDGLGVPHAESAPGPDLSPEPGPIFDPAEATLPNGSGLTETQSLPFAAFAPDTRVPFSIPKNPFARRR